MKALILLAMIGAALMLTGQFITHKQSKSPSADTQVFGRQTSEKLSEVKSKVNKSSFSSIDEYEAYYDQNLKDILEQISGVSHVSVMVTLSSSEKSIYQDNVKTQNNQTNETDKNGGKREVNEKSQDNEVVMVGEGDNKKPVVVGKEQPEVRGVLVVADGADNPTLQSWIMEAVSTVLDIPTYKVKVLPKS
ncbi:stage III sporulation protein AG [Terrilactibacillus sp. S3-3]|nr:stage III sporulation protein AG [Terrilactibacillus sp. S3-3]